MGSVVPEISSWSQGAIKKIKWGSLFFNLDGPIRHLSAEKRTKRSIVPGLIGEFTVGGWCRLKMIRCDSNQSHQVAKYIEIGQKLLIECHYGENLILVELDHTKWQNTWKILPSTLQYEKKIWNWFTLSGKIDGHCHALNLPSRSDAPWIIKITYWNPSDFLPLQRV